MIFRKKMDEVDDREGDPDWDHAEEVDWGVLTPREMEVVRLMGQRVSMMPLQP